MMDRQKQICYAARVRTAKDIAAAIGIMDLYAALTRPTCTRVHNDDGEADCSECGRHLGREANFCKWCGAKVVGQ